MGLFDNLFGKKDKIRVTFIDLGTGQEMETVDLRPDQLPESFEAETTMHIGSGDWIVKEADPMHASVFRKSGRLTLKMRKVEKININDINYILPTISEELPGRVEHPPFSDFVLTFHEDDWRQRECLLHEALPRIDAEFKNIREVWTLHRRDKENSNFPMFGKCYARNIIGEPNLRIPFDALKNLLGVTQTGSLQFERYPGYVENAFVLQNDAMTCYGIVENGMVTQLGIHEMDEEHGSELLLQRLLKTYGLVYVVWYNMQLVS